MVRVFRIFSLFVAGLPALALALGKIQVENAAVGQRTLVITVDDSILTPDLGKLKIEGYEIEQAVFVEEPNELPIQLNPNYIDMTAPGNGRILDFLPAPGLLVLDWPVHLIPHPGNVIGDTTHGGLLRRVVKVEGGSEPGAIGRRWTLTTVEADLTDAVLSGEMTFTTRLDLNQALPELSHGDEVMGYLPDGSANHAEAEYHLRGAQILFQPMVTGRIRIQGGKVEDFSFQVAGDCEVMADARGAFHGRGEFEYEDELPARPPLVMPLGNGLFLKALSRPFLRMEADAAGEGISAQAEFLVRNSLRGELAYSRGQWRPMAENKMTHASKAMKELWGEGHLKISIKPRMDFLLAGVQGPAFTFEPYVRFASTQDPKHPAFQGMGPLQGLDPAAVAGAPLADLRGMPRETGLLSPGNKEMGLGANIFMETRTTFTGPPLTRNFILFSREQTVYAPPREGTLSLKEADSNRVWLIPSTYPKADRYLIQQRIGNGPWENLPEQAALPRIRLGGLKPSTQYAFRAIGINAMGMGPAFPPEGIAFATPALNHPPFPPLAHLPDSGAVIPGAATSLSWRGGDPDAGARVQYSVLLDTRYPPLAVRAAGLTDTVLALADLKPGAVYYWQVVATDGRDTVEGPVRAFATRAAPKVQPRPAARTQAGYPMVALPRGTFLRDDGREIVVGPFEIGKYEVSQGEFERVTGRNPSYRLSDSLPVERVTWEEAEAFCREIGGRLPTEAEWEYAARAGSATPFYWGSGNPSEYAWFRENSGDRTQKVGLKKPNNWGLHDMAGNVFEWVQDWYGAYPPGLVHPRGAESGTAKVIRGASWYSEGGNLGLGTRYSNRPALRNFKVGFRCARDVELQAETPAIGAMGAAGLPDAGAHQAAMHAAMQAVMRPAVPSPSQPAAQFTSQPLSQSAFPAADQAVSAASAGAPGARESAAQPARSFLTR